MEGRQRASEAEAWTAFWQDQGAGSRCLQGASPDILQALGNHWSSFAAALSSGVSILDVGCGAGVVARTLVAEQRHLRVTGIDLATIPPSADPQIELLSRTPMESLPFADASFGAAVSQFGYEYGRMDEAAKELARVLAARAPFSLLVHHSESRIVANGRARNRALGHLFGGQVQAAFMSGDAAALDQQTTMLMRQFPGEILIKQAAGGLRSRIASGDRQRAAVWAAVAEALAPERRILDALEASCVAPDELDGWLAPLREMFEVRSPSAIRRLSGEPIAWSIEGAREGS